MLKAGGGSVSQGVPMSHRLEVYTERGDVDGGGLCAVPCRRLGGFGGLRRDTLGMLLCTFVRHEERSYL